MSFMRLVLDRGGGGLARLAPVADAGAILAERPIDRFGIGTTVRVSRRVL